MDHKCNIQLTLKELFLVVAAMVPTWYINITLRKFKVVGIN